MHRSNNSSPYPLFERLFAVILSVTDIKEITFDGCIAEVIPKNSGTNSVPGLFVLLAAKRTWQNDYKRNTRQLIKGKINLRIRYSR